MFIILERFSDSFYFGWSGLAALHKLKTKAWLLACTSNITLSLPAFTVSDFWRQLNSEQLS